MTHPDTTPHPHDWQKGGTSPRDGRTRWVTCGTCGRSWDDAFITGRTPAPAGRCPFEVDGECDTTPQGDPPVAIHLARSEWSRLEQVLRLMSGDEREMAREALSDDIRADLEEGAAWLVGIADTISAKTGGAR